MSKRVIRQKYSSDLNEQIIHTGQHSDKNMSSVFFDELNLPAPTHNLEISGGEHGKMTGRMLEHVEEILIQEQPDWVLIYGDTNSTLAGALAASKLHIPVAHVEAGLRSFNMKMPEEINRIVADRLSSMLFCPTHTAVENLQNEGITAGVHNFGDVMFDVALFYQKRALQKSSILDDLGASNNDFALATCHRAENTDDPLRLGSVLKALDELSKHIRIVFPLHPRTRKFISEYRLSKYLDNLTITTPLPFLDMVALEQSASFILTDSGGVQKEAFFYQVPCITMRDETEWVETLEGNWNQLVGADTDKILQAVQDLSIPRSVQKKFFGDGTTAEKVVNTLVARS